MPTKSRRQLQPLITDTFMNQYLFHYLSFMKYCKSHGIDVTTGRVLLLANISEKIKEPGCTYASILKVYDMFNMAVYERLPLLVEKGYLIKTKEGRIRYYVLSDKGKEFIKGYQKFYLEVYRDFFNNFWKISGHPRIKFDVQDIINLL